MAGKSIIAGLLVLAVLLSFAPISCGSEGGPVNLTRNPLTMDIMPSWSPDGSKIVFVSSTVEPPSDGSHTVTDQGIYVIDADGANRELILPGGGASYPSMSPDGNRIACAIGGGGIATINLDGTDLKQMIPAHPYVIDDWPSYSPDGSRILFAEEEGEGWRIYTMDTDFSNKTCLSPLDTGDEAPAWSPDGTKIAFDSNRDGHKGIYVMDADGGNPQRLTDNTVSGISPTWSPDGSRIAFVSARDGEYEIYIMNADGSNVAKLTDNDLFEMDPEWSPDGTKIVFSGEPPPDTEGHPDIYVVDVP